MFACVFFVKYHICMAHIVWIWRKNTLIQIQKCFGANADIYVDKSEMKFLCL